MMDEPVTWGSWIKQRRTVLGLSRLDLATSANCSISSIYHLESQLRRPSESMAQVLATQLQLHPQYHALFVAVARGTQPVSELPLPEYAQHAPESSVALPFAALPNAPHHLVGRTAELLALRRMLASSAQRLLTICGPGGVGKTQLCLALAHQVTPYFPYGMLWVDLTQVRSVKLLPLLLASIMQLPRTHPDTVWAQIVQVLQQQPCLLIIDNAEHLLPDLAPLLHDLLTAVPQLTVLVTSRRALNLPQEHVYQLAPFDVSELHATSAPDHLMQHPAVALFLQRMQQRGSVQDISAPAVQAIASICQLLDGLPLALELAAARTRVLPPMVLRDHLATQLLPLLHQHGPDRPQRQQTLALTIDWSYQLLAPPTQRLFAQLGVFVSAMDRATIHAVCAPTLAIDDLQQQLDQLLDVHLLIRTPQPDGEHTYGMLETVRAFAAELIRNTPLYHELMHAYTRYLITLCADFVPLTQGSTEQQQRYLLLQQQHPQIQRTLEYCVQQRITEATQVLSAVGYLWEGLGFWRELVYWGELISSTLPLAPREQLQVNLAYSRGLRYIGAPQQIIDLLEASVALATQHQYRDNLTCNLLHNLGATYLRCGRISAAQHCFQTQYTIAREINRHPTQIVALANLASVEHAQHNIDRALDLYEQGLLLARQHNFVLQICVYLLRIANIYINQGQTTPAAPLLVEGIDWADRLTLRAAQQQGILLQGCLALLEGKLHLAQEHLQRSLTQAHQSGNHQVFYETLEAVALLAAEAGHLHQARMVYNAATAVRHQHQVPDIHPSVLKERLAAHLERVSTPDTGATHATTLTYDDLLVLVQSI